MADIAHIAGLIAAGLHPSPFDYCDVVTSTTHKTMKGPRSGIIFYNIARVPDIQEKIDSAVFPTLQGGPHNNTIAGFAVQLNQVYFYQSNLKIDIDFKTRMEDLYATCC